jgi:hypothetical protein
LSGLQEILLIVGIVLAIVFIPRMTNRRSAETPPERRAPALSGRMRLAIVASLVYAAAVAAYLQPWKKETMFFVYVGLGPVAVGWLLFWVVAGFRRRRS